jgi:predicted HTH domain antitoxin
MNITVNLPDEVAGRLAEHWGDLSKRALAAVALEAYRSDVLTAAEVGELLGHGSRWETEAFLKEAGVYHSYTEADLKRDVDAIRKARDQ